MSDLKSFTPGKTVEENLALARHSANIGDTAHTILHAQEAVCMSVAALTDEIYALRETLKQR